MNIRLSCLIGISALSLAACGGGGGGGAPGTPSEAFTENAETVCNMVFDCEGEYDPAQHQDTPFADYAGASVDACVDAVLQNVEQFADGDLANMDESVDAGRLTYNPDDYEVCHDAIAGQTCDELFEQNGASFESPPECDTVIVGEVATGGECVIDWDCTSIEEFCDETTNTCG